MIVKQATNLVCPLDGLLLARNEKQLHCANGHCFDIARQGYINLLPVQQKRSRHPGDSKAMVEARTAFLQSGVYTPIAKKLSEIVQTLLMNSTQYELCLLDAGCGEGYYLDYLLSSVLIANVQQALSFIGYDISKPAIIAASKRNQQISWLVASNKQPPIQPQSVDIILSLFGFPEFAGFKRLLKPGGRCILVDAGPEHLIEVRKIVYKDVKQTTLADLARAEAAGFSLIEQTPLCYRHNNLSHEQIMNLLTMTPHLYRATRTGKQAIQAVEKMDLTVDVSFRVLG